MPTFGEIRVGDRADLSHMVTDGMIRQFAEVTGDANPVHLDDAYAKETVFKGRVAHGMLSAAFISAVLGMRLPGPGTIYLSQSLRFLAPVRPGETVATQVEVLEKDDTRRRIRLKTTCRVRERTVVEGEALVQLS